MTKHHHTNDLIRPEEVTLDLLEELIQQHGSERRATNRHSSRLISRSPHYAGIHEDVKIVLLAGDIALRRNGSLRKILGFVNWLNNANKIVRFSFLESVSAENPCDRGALPDGGRLVGSISLPFQSGFSGIQFMDSWDILTDGLNYAFNLAVEDGLVDDPVCDKCAETLEAKEKEEDVHAH